LRTPRTGVVYRAEREETAMIPSEREHILRELSEVDRSNLKLARVTRQALWEAARRPGRVLLAGALEKIDDIDETHVSMEVYCGKRGVRALGGRWCTTAGMPQPRVEVREAKEAGR